MKYSLKADVHSLEDGRKIILQEFFKYSRDGDHVRHPAMVVTYHAERRLRDYGYASLPKDNTRPHVVTSDGTRFDIVFDRSKSMEVSFRDADGNCREVMWTLPVPDAPDDEIIAFARAFRGEGTLYGKDKASDHDLNAVFVVERIEGRYAICRMVSWLNDTLGEIEKGSRKTEGGDHVAFDDDAFFFLPPEVIEGFPAMLEKSGPHALSSYEINVPLKTLPEEVAAGSIVVGSDFSCRYVKGVLTTTVLTPRIAAVLDAAGLEKWLPCPAFDENRMTGRSTVMMDGFHRLRPVVPIAALQDHLKEIERAKEALLPDEALVVVFPPEQGIDLFTPHFVLLGMRGAMFFDDGGHARENLEHKVPEEGGLWVFSDAQYWSHHDAYSGEWDGGLDGNWRPATDADLATFGYTRDQVIVEASDAYEEGDEWEQALADGSFTEKMMEIAASVHTKELERAAALEAKLAS
jgi:hypothetical protein